MNKVLCGIYKQEIWLWHSRSPHTGNILARALIIAEVDALACGQTNTFASQSLKTSCFDSQLIQSGLQMGEREQPLLMGGGCLWDVLQSRST